MRVRIKKYLFILILSIFSMLGFAESTKAPNTLITENPDKAVTTIEAPKNREHAEMKITVNKVNIIEVEGEKVDNHLLIKIDEKLTKENIIVVNDINKIDELKNRMRKDEILIPFELEETEKETLIKIEASKLKEKNIDNNKVLYIVYYKDNEIKKVYQYMEKQGKINKRAEYRGEGTITLDKRLILSNYVDFSFYPKESHFIPLSGPGYQPSDGLTIFDVDDIARTFYSWEKLYDIDNAWINGNEVDELGTFNSGHQPYMRNRGTYQGFSFRSGDSVNLFPMYESLKKHMFYSVATTSDMYTVRFRGRTTGDSNTSLPSYFSFDMIIKYKGDVAQKGEATLNMGNVNTNSSVSWNKNNIFNSGMIKSEDGKATLNITSGKLFNWYSAVKTNEVATYLIRAIDLKNSNNKVVGTNSKNPEVTINGYKFMINKSNDGKFTIQKLANASKGKIKIEIYSGGNNTGGPRFFLGSLILNIDNETIPTTTPIGEVKMKVDKRLTNKDGAWIFADGYYSGGINNNGKAYPEFVALDGNFNINSIGNIQIKDATMTGKTNGGEFTSRNTKYIAFKKGSNWNQDAGAIPKGITLGNLISKIVINKINRESSNNNFTLIGNNNNQYTGNIREEYVGDLAKTTTTKLDLTSLNYQNNDWVRFDNPNSKTSTTSSGKTVTLEGDTFFNFKSVVKNTPHIITKLEITKDNNDTKVVGGENEETNQRLEIDFPDNKIGVERNGGIFIHKKTDNTKPITYTIKGYYKDILLGTTQLTIVNKKASFEIVDGSGRLDFGDFFKGEIRVAQTRIKFKNEAQADISIGLAKTDGEMTLNGASTSNPNEKIKLSDFRVWGLDTSNPKENTFRIQGKATSIPTNEIGEYKGTMEVIITVNPK